MKLNFKYLFIAYFILLTISQFWLLNKEELQPWDESIYAVRIQYAVESGNWMDQTEGSVGGFYSSAHPPLYIWLSGLSVKLFGLNTFGLRFWSLMFGLGMVLLAFFIPKNNEKGFYAAVILGCIPFLQAYFKLGQLDTIYPFFLILGLYWWMKYQDGNKQRFLIHVGLAFGLAMMSKIIVGLFLPMSIGLFLLFEIIQRKKKMLDGIKEVAIILVVGLIISLPWHVYMLVQHGQTFIDGYLKFHILSRVFEGVDQNTSSLGPVFFINQLIVMLSVSLVAILWHLGRNIKKITAEDILYLCFALVPFVIFTVSSTKIRTYTIPMLAPLALLAANALFELRQQKKIQIWFLAALLFVLSWSASQYFRDHLQALDIDKYIILVLAGIVVITVILKAVKLQTWMMVLFIIVFTIVQAFIQKPIVYHKHNLNEVVDYYYENEFEKLIYLDTKRTADDPLITYYFKGIDLHDIAEFQMLRPEEKPVFELNHKNRNSMIIINTYHENEYYWPYTYDIESKGVKMFEDELYDVYVW